MSCRLLPSIPSQIFPVSLEKLLVSLLAWAPTFRVLETQRMGGFKKIERKTYPRKLIYTRTSPTVRLCWRRNKRELQGCQNPWSPEPKDLPTSVVSEGTAIFLIQFPLLHQHQNYFSSPQVYSTPLLHDLISHSYPNYCLITLLHIAYFLWQQGWTKNLNFKRNSIYFLSSLPSH